jgi:drug/metabolite transporter (DMT)-like permease
MSHRKAVWVMVLAALLWSIAGVVTRHLEAARSFELTFWRSAANALALVMLLTWLRGREELPDALRRLRGPGGRVLWVSGLCWATMFTAFMVALTLTSVANVLVTMAIGPFLTALGARVFLGHRLSAGTWLAIAVAGVGIGWMYGHQAGLGETSQLLGIGVALAVPLAAAVNWTLLQHLSRQDAPPDMLVAVLLGAVISAAVTLPLAWPLRASAHDIGLLAMLGAVQLAVPCLMAVAAARVLSAPEIALLGLLEVIFGVLWAWVGAGEAPSSAVFGGGALVLLALAGNSLLSWQRAPR